MCTPQVDFEIMSTKYEVKFRNVTCLHTCTFHSPNHINQNVYTLRCEEKIIFASQNQWYTFCANEIRTKAFLIILVTNKNSLPYWSALDCNTVNKVIPNQNNSTHLSVYDFQFALILALKMQLHAF